MSSRIHRSCRVAYTKDLASDVKAGLGEPYSSSLAGMGRARSVCAIGLSSQVDVTWAMRSYAGEGPSAACPSGPSLLKSHVIPEEPDAQASSIQWYSRPLYLSAAAQSGPTRGR